MLCVSTQTVAQLLTDTTWDSFSVRSHMGLTTPRVHAVSQNRVAGQTGRGPEPQAQCLPTARALTCCLPHAGARSPALSLLPLTHPRGFRTRNPGGRTDGGGSRNTGTRRLLRSGPGSCPYRAVGPHEQVGNKCASRPDLCKEVVLEVL